ncbi:MAG: hypothetical protein KDA66_20725, partial [Planctomycetaceae bacterium]|nr:hypothetical protein [Planctomycetaceae bacterium]
CKNMFVLTRSEQLPRPRSPQRKSKKPGVHSSPPIMRNESLPARETRPALTSEPGSSKAMH